MLFSLSLYTLKWRLNIEIGLREHSSVVTSPRELTSYQNMGYKMHPTPHAYQGASQCTLGHTHNRVPRNITSGTHIPRAVQCNWKPHNAQTQAHTYPDVPRCNIRHTYVRATECQLRHIPRGPAMQPEVTCCSLRHTHHQGLCSAAPSTHTYPGILQCHLRPTHTQEPYNTPSGPHIPREKTGQMKRTENRDPMHEVHSHTGNLTRTARMES